MLWAKIAARDSFTRVPDDFLLLEVGKESELREREAQPVAEVGGTALKIHMISL